jgi:hypothetical protein
MAGNAGNTFNAQTSRTMGAAPHNTQTDASILDAQASLAADKQQVAPVHRYAPGDDSH